MCDVTVMSLGLCDVILLTKPLHHDVIRPFCVTSQQRVHLLDDVTVPGCDVTAARPLRDDITVLLRDVTVLHPLRRDVICPFRVTSPRCAPPP